ncbi:MAG TPA: hypothetical protein VD965_05050 [Burkholderiales bacterium]|nr:hypothetical protein [Burkholderiales bacterium]
MITRRQFLLLTGALLPLPAAAQAGAVHEISGDVRLNGFPMATNSAVFAGQTITTGDNGRVWFTLGADAFFLRPGSELRLRAQSAAGVVIDALRLVTGAMGATFGRGRPRSVITPSATIGIRGTGVYVEASALETYACNCFGAVDIHSTATGTMMESVRVMAENHQARRIHRDPQGGMRIQRAPFERHTNEEIIRLESLTGRPSPFRA